MGERVPPLVLLQNLGTEKNLKNIHILLMSLMITVVFPSVRLNAADRVFQKATVVDTEEHTKVLPRRGKATDAPPPTTEFDHDISIQLGCSLYVVRYRSVLDYLPTTLTPGHSIEVSPEKHVLYAKIPGNADARMSIIQLSTVKGESCAPNK